jgi:hypothetical protein
MANPNSSFLIGNLNGSNGFALNATSSGTAGLSVASANVNGDKNGALSIDDVIIGSPAGTNSATYVVFGNTNPLSTFGSAFNLGPGGSALTGGNGFTLKTPGIGSDMGQCVAGADLTGDTNAEVFAGAPALHSNYGSVYSVLGKSSGWTATVDLSTLP